MFSRLYRHTEKSRPMSPDGWRVRVVRDDSKSMCKGRPRNIKFDTVFLDSIQGRFVRRVSEACIGHNDYFEEGRIDGSDCGGYCLCSCEVGNVDLAVKKRLVDVTEGCGR